LSLCPAGGLTDLRRCDPPERREIKFGIRLMRLESMSGMLDGWLCAIEQ
jgi:hypothetical protein